LIGALRVPVLLSIVPALAAGVMLAGSSFGRLAYAPPAPTAVDTVRARESAHSDERARTRSPSVVPGYLSSWGLPPVQGRFTISDTALVFEPSEGSATPLGSRVSLAYVDRENGRNHYLFRVDAGVIETDVPGALLELTSDSVWLRGLTPAAKAQAGPVKTAPDVVASLYADTLYLLFGRPRAPVGLIGPKGRAAGRLGEYIARRDSLAFDPVRMTGETQFRHALAHELAHRWQARARGQLLTLWAGIPAIRDPKRYGYGDQSEHQAEAAAFAVSFLQATAHRQSKAAVSLSLLDHYELLVPGTRTMVRYFALQPIYRSHPLRSLLTAGPLKHALAK
jgi:hypothetical protein